MTACLLAAVLLSQVQVSDTSHTKVALLSADRRLARQATGEPLAFGHVLDSAAVFLAPDLPLIQGRNEIISAYAARYANRDTPTRFTWTPQHAVASSDGGFGCTVGTTAWDVPGDTAGEPRAGRYVTCWTLGSDGQWRIVAHARNGELPGLPTPTAALTGAPRSATGTSNNLDSAIVTDALFSRVGLSVGPGPAFAQFAADDGMLLGPRPVPLRGPEQLGAAFRAFPAGRRLMWNPLRDAGAAKGGLAVTVGIAAVGDSSGTSAEDGPSKYLTVWRQEPSGAWRFIFDLGSGRPADTPLDGHFAMVVRLQARLDSLHATGRFPGATFAAALPDGKVVALATGLSDTAQRSVMSPRALMPQGSVGKTYVSALAMQLVHEGKLDLDAKVSHYLGQEPWFGRLPNAADITVRQVMTHSSGLVRYEFSEKFTAELSSAPADRRWKPAEQIGYILGTTPPFKAGEGWQYSDTNYLILGLIIEKLTGQPMIEEIQRRLVTPLRLTETVPNLGPSVPGVVQGYAGPRNPFGGKDAMLTDGRFGINPQFEWAGGGWSSTTADLARWGKLLYEWKAFDSSLSARFLEGVPARLGQNTLYGLGVIIWKDTPLGTALGHSGFFPGYQTELRYFPERRFAVALQVNASSGRVLPRGMGGGAMELAEIVASGIR